MGNKRQRLARKKFRDENPVPEEVKPAAADGEELKPTNKKLKLERWKKRMEKERAREEKLAAKKRSEKPVGSCWACGEDGHRSSDCPSNNRHKICLGCRGRGHTLKTCPNATGAERGSEGPSKGATKFCYNCGEEGHNLSGCKKPIKDGGTQFATCFVCKQKGHISAACPQNEHGIYPKGGSCKHCQSVRHLAKDCPEKAPKSTVYGRNTPAPPAAGLSAKKTVFASGDDLEDDFTGLETPAKAINWGSDDEAREGDAGEDPDSKRDDEVVFEALGESKNVTRKRHSVGSESKKKRKASEDEDDRAMPQSAPAKMTKKKAKTVTF
ncbi:hypothetical protein KFL_003650100 [Klebsormidium nitens]|uniref:CCHC-type domain-containing protein n=1 Tax=Klebsormidium nitens TaxID=105231 RepID=A0A1Y1IDV8_KLENI|nr:hypothetical protein KFL_003650100 [Klebsormidium nitens]|eukprot:GAQ87619.1 hypothetical protein KFL_003650100 [Klebsormidium nitens]